MSFLGGFLQGAVCLYLILLRETVAQSDGRCFNFHLTVASNSTDYFYTCCDKLGGVTVKTDENIKIPTFNYDCNPFRLNRTELSQNQQHFNCNGKKTAEKLCNRRWGWLSTDDCWVWSTCFEEACKLETQAAELVCGDGRCDLDESTASCPLDCCPFENPEMCTIKNSTCSRPCCGESACCNNRDEFTATSDTFWLIVGTIVASVLCLFYLCCCCCCCCCKKLYNSMFHPSKKRRHSLIISGMGRH